MAAAAEELPDSSSSDLCQQLLDRYSTSSAPQHRHLLATAAATRSILVSESLPLTPTAYFAASISSISNQTLDSDAISALASFLSILLPLVPPQGISPSKAGDAVRILISLLKSESGEVVVSNASVRALVKCLGVLVGFCDLEDWVSVRLGFETLLHFSIDKRPKVRKCAQICVEKVFKSFQSDHVIKEASKLVLSLFKRYMPLAVSLSTSKTANGLKDEAVSEHLEVLHVLNLIKLVVPFLSVNVSSKIFAELRKLIVSHFYVLTRHIFQIVEAYFQASRVEAVTPELETILMSLSSYISLGNENPLDTVNLAMSLSKRVLDELHSKDLSSCTRNLSPVIQSIAGFLMTETSTTSHAQSVLKDLINNHMNQRDLLINESELLEDTDTEENSESSAIKSICGVFENILSSYDESPNEALLAVISVLFIKLGGTSCFFMKNILLKLADLITNTKGDLSTSNHLQTCIGSAVIAMGPEKILTLLPISIHDNDLTCSNIWFIPILKNYVIEASVGYYLDQIVPLAESFERACHKDVAKIHRMAC